MSFYVETSTGNKYEWWLQDVKPDVVGEVVLFSADGDELGVLVRRINNVMYIYPITRWRGDIASFLYENLCY